MPPTKIARYGLKTSFALFGGVLMGLTPAPVEAWFLAWIGLIPLWLLVSQSSQEKHPYRRAIIYSTAWGAGYHGLALAWITGIHPMTWLGVPWLPSLLITTFCWGFITFWGILYVALWSLGMTALIQKLQPSLGVRIVVASALWCTLEMIWAGGNLYWTSLSYTQSPHNLIIIHLGQLSGPLTVTALIVAVNGLIAETILTKNQKIPLFGSAIALLIISHLIGWGLYTRPLAQNPDTAIKVGIIQGNIPNEIKLSSVGWQKALIGYKEGYETLVEEGVDVVLTPETSLPFIWDQPVSRFNPLQQDFYNTVLAKQIPVWIGGFGRRGSSLTNSLFSVNTTGEIVGRYDKVKLVPLGEYIPLEQTLGRIVERLSPLDAHLIAGKPDQTFNTPFGLAIAGICYDSPFPNLFRRQASQGGQFIISASNNAHYSADMPRQHHAQDIMRAVETDRWAVRATNTGYSAIVDPHGRTLWFSDLDQYQLHNEIIYRRQTKTPYVRWGNWLTPLLICLAVASSFWRCFHLTF